MLLTGSLALNILFYYPINLKKLSHQINLTYGILKHSKFGSFTNFQRLFESFGARFHFNLTGRG